MLAPLLLTLCSILPGSLDAARNDARLNDLCFVDAQQGWAVGDRGVIWHTDDAGQHWQQQASGVECPLHSVFFANAQLGWAAGGSTRPYTHTSSGVVLITYDGGKTWKNNPKLVLPALRRIAFFTPRQGWAIACRSAMYPGGAFLTDDGGRSWRPIPGGNADWTAADFLDPRLGLVVGRNGAVALVRGNELEPLPPNNELRTYFQVRFLSPTAGWLVGEGGLVQNIGLSGVAPQSPPNLPPSARLFDFATLAVRGPKCWIAGSPGTRIFHTPDAGQTWTTFDTGTPVPLRAIAFVDDEHGWAVGELGTILVTADGGRTWQPQHVGGSRAALLAVVAEPDDVPLELLARVSGNEGYLSVVELLGRRDIEIVPRDAVPLPDRLHEAVVRVGGCAAAEAWQFPLRQAGLRVDSRQIVDAWDRTNDGRGLDALRARIVRQIRTWRPEAIVTDDARSGDDPLVSLVHQAVTEAIAQAADAAAFPDQVAAAGLKPWQVRQTYAAMPPGSRGVAEMTTAQFMPALGRSLAEAVAEPRGLLCDHFTLSPPTLAFHGAGGSDRRDFLAALGLPPGGEARRELPRPPVEGLDLMQRIARKRRHVLAILDQSHRIAWSPEQLIAQIDELTRDLDADSAGQILYQLADQYYHSGRWAAAAETFQALAERYPQHSLTPPAQQWLIQYYASSEAAWRVQHDPSQQTKRFERAIAIGTDLERTRFDQFIEPATRFSVAAAYRNLGRMHDAERLYQAQSRDNGRDAWSACAQSELHLNDPKSRPLKSVLICVKTDAKPHLDGRLDEPIWRKAKSAALQSPQHDDGDWPAEVLAAHDDEFLYLAIRCRNAPGDVEPLAEDDPTRPVKRPRDGDLSSQDRVEVFLDLDRDYSTYYRLAVDRRGWTNDSFWGDTTWNPEWFVATRREKNEWTVEAAIPLAELTGTPPKPRDIWAIGIHRIIPNIGFQSWTTPAAVNVLPDGFGYLMFE
jgi:photosystem II stability/assembly factor-like uncharacterized protein/tetratricopeptide (TPR) repeat protein